MKCRGTTMLRTAVVFSVVLALMTACSSAARPTTPKTGPTPELASGTPAEAAASVTKDVVFATTTDADEREWKLDIYAPSGPGLCPVVVFAHAFGGQKEGYEELSQKVAQQGALVFTFDWPTPPEDVAMRADGLGMRQMIETVACAVRFAHARAPEYDGDPESITLGGHSYGAAIGAWVALVGDDTGRLWEDFAADHGAPPSVVRCTAPEGSVQVDALVGVAGVYDAFGLDRYRAAYPDLTALVDVYSQIGGNLDLRVRLIHGEADEVSVDHSADFHGALVEAGYDSELKLWDGKHRVPIDLTVGTIIEVTQG
jgi:acetyl esterase/lipase